MESIIHKKTLIKCIMDINYHGKPILVFHAKDIAYKDLKMFHLNLTTLYVYFCLAQWLTDVGASFYVREINNFQQRKESGEEEEEKKARGREIWQR